MIRKKRNLSQNSGRGMERQVLNNQAEVLQSELDIIKKHLSEIEAELSID